MRLRLDPLAPMGVSVAPEPTQTIIRGAVAGQVGKIDSIKAGTNVTVDTSDPKNPIISATGGGGEGGTNATNLAATLSATNTIITSDTGTDATIPAADGTNAGVMTPTMKTKLDGIATSATANDTDANLKNRANHTGTQPSTTISDFTTAVDTRIATVVDAAPASLDTLNELAAALGDDANFASTVTTSLAGKASTVHGHAIADVTDLQTALDEKLDSTNSLASVELTNEGSPFGPGLKLDVGSGSGMSYITATDALGFWSNAGVDGNGDYNGGFQSDPSSLYFVHYDGTNTAEMLLEGTNGLKLSTTGQRIAIKADLATTDRTLQLPDADGTLATESYADTKLSSVVAGTNVTIDTTDPQNPIINATGGGGGGSGDVVGPASSTDNALVRFDGTTGKLVQSSSVFITDQGDFVTNGELRTDNGAGGVVGLLDGYISATDGAGVNTINEHTLDAGVTVDGVLIKDGLVDGKDVSALTANTGDVTLTGTQTLTDKTLTTPTVTTLTLKDPIDTTKVATIDVSGIATGTTRAISLPNASGTLVTTASTSTLTNKTLTAPVLGGTVTGTYTLGGTPTFPSTVVSTTGTQTLTNKTLTSPTINTPTFSAGSIPFAALANAAIVTHRQGGSTTDWSIPGTTSQTVGQTRVQTGSFTTSSAGTATITFPVAFSQVPVLVGTVLDNSVFCMFQVQTISTTTAVVSVFNLSGTRVISIVQWIAIGTV